MPGGEPVRGSHFEIVFDRLLASGSAGASRWRRDYGDLYSTAKRYGLTELHRERSLYGRSSHSDAGNPAPRDA